MVCMHARECVSLHVCVNGACMYAYMCLCERVCGGMCDCEGKSCTCMCVCVHVCACVCAYVCVYVHICVSIPSSRRIDNMVSRYSRHLNLNPKS
jgi:hypothetical protein